MKSQLEVYLRNVNTERAFELLIKGYNMPPSLQKPLSDCLDTETRHVVHLPSKYSKAFDILWAKRCPIVISVQDRIQLQWNPSSLKQLYGKQKCLVIECQDTSKQTNSQLHLFLDKMDSVGGKLFKVKVMGVLCT